MSDRRTKHSGQGTPGDKIETTGDPCKGRGLAGTRCIVGDEPHRGPVPGEGDETDGSAPPDRPGSLEAKDHPDVFELHRRVVAQCPHIALATVYRTVKRLEAEGILERDEFRDGHARFEQASKKHHDHLIDLETGTVIEFRNAEIEGAGGDCTAARLSARQPSPGTLRHTDPDRHSLRRGRVLIARTPHRGIRRRCRIPVLNAVAAFQASRVRLIEPGPCHSFIVWGRSRS